MKVARLKNMSVMQKTVNRFTVQTFPLGLVFASWTLRALEKFFNEWIKNIELIKSKMARSTSK